MVRTRDQNVAAQSELAKPRSVRVAVSKNLRLRVTRSPTRTCTNGFWLMQVFWLSALELCELVDIRANFAAEYARSDRISTRTMMRSGVQPDPRCLRGGRENNGALSRRRGKRQPHTRCRPEARRHESAERPCVACWPRTINARFASSFSRKGNQAGSHADELLRQKRQCESTSIAMFHRTKLPA